MFRKGNLLERLAPERPAFAQIGMQRPERAVCELNGSRDQHTFSMDRVSFHEPMTRRKINELCTAPP